MSIAIRPIVTGDVPQLATIERHAAERFRSVGLDRIADGDTADAGFIEAIIAKGTALGATNGGDILVAFVLAGTLDDALHIYELSVDPAYGRRGIASALLDHLEGQARDRRLAALTLSTFAEVPWNAPFYARRGFATVAGDDWSPAFHLLHFAERAAGLSFERRVFMRREIT